jgi:hypothetical protein
MPPLPLLQLGRSIAWRASGTSDSHQTGSGYKIQDLLLVNRITVQYEVLRYRGVRFGVNRIALAARLSLPVFPNEQAFSGAVGMSQKCR